MLNVTDEAINIVKFPLRFRLKLEAIETEKVTCIFISEHSESEPMILVGLCIDEASTTIKHPTSRFIMQFYAAKWKEM